jgi:hypothetical protein
MLYCALQICLLYSEPAHQNLFPNVIIFQTFLYLLQLRAIHVFVSFGQIGLHNLGRSKEVDNFGINDHIPVK